MQEKSQRYKRGMEVIDKYADKSEKPAYSITFEDLMSLDDELENYIVEFAFGDIYSREGLSDEQKTLLTISSLVTQGLEPQLRLHINTGLTIGITPKEIVNAIIHLLPYTGFPRVLNALKVAKAIFEERSLNV
ncbi:carboxymuconolactone decarboxylase family protein [Sphingobacterium sp. UT-1RO-CII-1]|uniref:carboxymuconolactone decarboxylase family protein n=1 Tax=Sphingobacterium sp. UT-1RO-CII-1 TaxID=2995225 RepID=UPI00227B5DA0|nr:carboxymuconolactone decarboxylase family protein [Sphingobacterium sp. UT-1RO-CII-1]MCY4781308.1 carboxymuconolactone decarboxylase family protein [Sphingobacterium sp. UT-1RO-CII-1]